MYLPAGSTDMFFVGTAQSYQTHASNDASEFLCPFAGRQKGQKDRVARGLPSSCAPG